MARGDAHMGPHTNWSRVYPGLYLGNLQGLTDPALMTHISAIVSIVPMTEEILAAINVAGYDHMYIPISDSRSTPIAPYFEPAYAFIQSHLARGEAVYVHCFAGISRSASLVLYWLMRTHGLTPPEALLALRQRRPVVNPNDGFLAALHDHAPHP